MKKMSLTATVAGALAIVCGAMTVAGVQRADRVVPVVESLPHTEQFDSGQITFDKLSDRQLTAFLIDLTRRANYDRAQHNGQPGPDSAYLYDWQTRTTDVMVARNMGADEHDVIGGAAQVEK